MKKYFNRTALLAGLGLIILASCSKDESKIYYTGGTAPVLTASATDSIPLPVTDTTAKAVTFSWTSPNYTFTNGPSSLNVTYYLQFDTLGAGFTSPHMQTVAISAALSNTFTVSQLNAVFGNGLLLQTGVSHNVQVRLESFIQPYTTSSAQAAVLYSDTLTFEAVPYTPPPTITPPTNDSLYIVGSAVAADNWANPIPAADVASETFTKMSATDFQIKIALVGGGEYKLINQNNGSWAYQWSVATVDTDPNGGPFVENGANCIAPSASGTYLIDVNFQTGVFTVTAD